MLHPDQLIKESSDVSSDWDGSKARLKIRAVYPEDEGEYSCIVYNDMGKAVTSAAIVVESEHSDVKHQRRQSKLSDVKLRINR